jgi:hypothetical protein
MITTIMCPKYISEHLKIQKVSGGACTQTPLGSGSQATHTTDIRCHLAPPPHWKKSMYSAPGLPVPKFENPAVHPLEVKDHWTAYLSIALRMIYSTLYQNV